MLVARKCRFSAITTTDSSKKWGFSDSNCMFYDIMPPFPLCFGIGLSSLTRFIDGLAHYALLPCAGRVSGGVLMERPLSSALALLKQSVPKPMNEIMVVGYNKQTNIHPNRNLYLVGKKLFHVTVYPLHQLRATFCNSGMSCCRLCNRCHWLRIE